VREICLRALENRRRSRRELEQALERKKVDPEVAARVLDRLAAVGLVDDLAYARAFVASRQRTRPRGARALAAELARKGIGRDIVSRVLEERTDEEDPLEAARRALAPKLRALRGRPSEEVRRKAEQFLLRRGFSYVVARDILAELAPVEDSE
jgi:regulatory protein